MCSPQDSIFRELEDHRRKLASLKLSFIIPQLVFLDKPSNIHEPTPCVSLTNQQRRYNRTFLSHQEAVQKLRACIWQIDAGESERLQNYQSHLLEDVQAALDELDDIIADQWHVLKIKEGLLSNLSQMPNFYDTCKCAMLFPPPLSNA